MLTQIGFIFLVLSTVFNSLNLFFIIIRKDDKIITLIFYLSLFSLISILLSFLSLISSYLISDFLNLNVFLNSHSAKPLIYKITAAWGNHEGSMLLWLLVMNCYTFAFSFNKSLSINTKKWTIFFQSFLTIGFCLFVILSSNPFIINEIKATEGLGFNPILQDPALAIHPPILYFGYVGFSLLLSLAVSGLITNSVDVIWSKVAKKWAILSWSMLTGGIAVGSYWAYYELGWGGWWFWDPVENASVLPWLSGLALIHSLTLIENNQLLKRWSIFLSILCFSLSLVGTFLVRSGILTSVHAFASDPSRGLFILILFLVFTGFSFLIFIIKAPKENSYNKFLFINKTTALIINNITMMIACFAIFLGTIYPIIIETITNQRISVGAPYYNSTVIPIVLPGLLLMSITPILNWQTNKLKNGPLYLYLFILLSFFVLIFYFYSSFNIFGLLGLLISLYIIFSSIIAVVKELSKAKKINYINFLLYNNSIVAHFGVGIFILGITISSTYQEEYKKNIKLNEIVEVGNYKIVLNKIKIIEEQNYQSLKGSFFLKKNNKIIAKIEPEKRYYYSSKIVTTEAGIFHSFLKDFYIVLGDQKDDLWSIKFYQNPLILFIWLGATIMMMGGFLGIIKK